MILNDEQLCSMVQGSAWTSTIPQGLIFHRFTREQADIYSGNSSFFMKTRASSGISLEFETEAESFSFEWSFFPGSSRKFAWFDLLLDGVLVSHQGTDDLTKNQDGKFFFEFPAGKHHVELVFPCLAGAAVRKAELAGASFVKPVPEKEKTILFLGDSITQGYDAKYPSLALPNLLSRFLGTGKLCRAIGGEIFNPLIPGGEKKQPSLIYSAYGTNDWSKCTAEEYVRNAEGYFKALANCCPGVPVFVLLPVWRKDFQTTTKAGTFAEMEQMIRNAAALHPCVCVQEGLNLIPHIPEFFSDGWLHPNDTGFLCLARELEKEMRNFMKQQIDFCV